MLDPIAILERAFHALVMPRPIFATIDLAAIRHNLSVARRHAAGRAIWAVIKANAYGHGIERVLPALDAADGLALLDLAEAQRARAAGWQGPILLLEGFFEVADLAVVDALALTAMVHDAGQVELLEAIDAARLRAPIDVFVKVDTGMSRLGFRPDHVGTTLQRLAALPHVRVRMLATHFANADRDDGPVDVASQVARFEQARRDWQGPTCLANSAALLMRPDAGGDAVRPGIALYGGSPGAMPAERFGLRPAMYLRSRIIAVQSLLAGQRAGYGSRWQAPRPTRLGVVACGYADGYPRIAADGTPVFVAGARAPLAGRVSMDMLTIDLAGTTADIGDEVELWGAQVPVDEVAGAAGTVGYELMCALAARVPVAVRA